MPQPLDGNRLRSSEPYPGSPQVCPGVIRALSEPDGKGVVKDGAHDGLIIGHQSFSREAPVRPC